MKKLSKTKRIGGKSPVYLAAVAEYLASELLEVAGKVATKERRKRISPSDLSTALRTDPDLDKLFGGVGLCSGSALSRSKIRAALRPPKREPPDAAV